MTLETLRMCHQALAQVPAANAQQAAGLARALGEIESEIQQIQAVVMKPTLVPQPIETAGPGGTPPTA